jgi:pilus assembly protein FimV
MQWFKVCLMVLSLMGFTNTAHAVGLGEIVVESGLNEPLKARIPFLQAKDLDAAQLNIALASEKVFEERNVSREYFYQAIRFKIDLKHPSGPCITLTTLQAVKEPYLDFLVELSWPSGKLIKGFTVLLEHPGT